MKRMEDIKKIAVIGAGVMGRGIALVCVRAGFETILFDMGQDMLDHAHGYLHDFFKKSVAKGKMSQEEMDASMSRLSTTVFLETCVADLVIEAVPEKLSIKHSVFLSLEKVNAADTIFASNTSTIPITQIAGALAHPERVAGLHFFNPAPLMKLVEVIGGVDTDPVVLETLTRLSATLGKTPVQVSDEPGFIVNRVARQFYLESLRCVEEGVTSPEAVDRIMESTGFRMGPFRLMDLIGVETNHAVSQSLYEAFFYAGKFRPSRLQQKMVDAGRWGKKSGRGFYDYR